MLHLAGTLNQSNFKLTYISYTILKAMFYLLYFIYPSIELSEDTCRKPGQQWHFKATDWHWRESVFLLASVCAAAAAGLERMQTLSLSRALGIQWWMGFVSGNGFHHGTNQLPTTSSWMHSPSACYYPSLDFSLLIIFTFVCHVAQQWCM